MILVDSSAWIEFTRHTGSIVADTVDRLLTEDLAICEAIQMEVLAGARDEAHLRNLEIILARSLFVPIISRDYDEAAALYRQCRRRGQTVRKMIDCLVAAVAIRVDAPVLHMDRDYDILARHTPMQSYLPV